MRYQGFLTSWGSKIQCNRQVWVHIHSTMGNHAVLVELRRCCSVSRSCPTLCNPINWSSPGFPVLHHLLEFAETHVHLDSDIIQSSHPLQPLSSPKLYLSNIRIFSNELALYTRWPKYWSFRFISFKISPFSEYSGLIPFRIDWFDLITVQRTLKCLLQHHNLKASVLQC